MLTCIPVDVTLKIRLHSLKSAIYVTIKSRKSVIKHLDILIIWIYFYICKLKIHNTRLFHLSPLLGLIYDLSLTIVKFSFSTIVRSNNDNTSLEHLFYKYIRHVHTPTLYIILYQRIHIIQVADTRYFWQDIYNVLESLYQYHPYLHCIFIVYLQRNV